MNQKQRNQIENLDKLIGEKIELKKLAQSDAYKLLLQKLAEIRVDALDAAVSRGDTTDEKAYARAIGTILNFLYSLENDFEVNDLIKRREIIKNEIDFIEKQRRERQSNLNQGLQNTL